jgi:serine/threonine-protein kinase HipA
MAFRHPALIEVRYDGATVGALAPSGSGAGGPIRFQYDSGWLRRGIELAPFLLPISDGARVFEFRGLRPETFHALPPTFADSLPDRFGNRIIDAWMARQGVSATQITALDRLAYVGARAMGALEYRPPRGPSTADPTILDLAELTVAARAAIEGRLDADGRGSDDRATRAALQTVLQVGTSAGGARPKAVLNVDDTTGAFRSGALPPLPGETAWLLKFDGVTDERTLAESRQYTRIEYAYSLMAHEIGISMAECRLLHEGGRAHFMTRRFDRPSPEVRVHMTTLCGLRALDNDDVGVHDYAQLFETIATLDLGEEAMVEAFRRMVFNVAAVNHDDHTKNHAFLMDAEGRWSLAPAYDLSYANVPGHPWMGQHCMGVDGAFALIDDDRMLRLADRFAIPYAKRELRRVHEVVDAWPEFAELAGVPADQIAAVRTAQQTLGRGLPST